LTGAPLEDERARVEACRQIVTSGGAEIVALSLGHEGAMLVTGGGAWRAPALPMKIVSAVGAGDSFVAGMVWSMARGHSLVDAFRCGVAAGSAALLTPGTELSHADDIHRLLKDVTATPV
jgi:6-phosphofructokinase 2